MAKQSVFGIDASPRHGHSVMMARDKRGRGTRRWEDGELGYIYIYVVCACILVPFSRPAERSVRRPSSDEMTSSSEPSSQETDVQCMRYKYRIVMLAASYTRP